MIWVDINFANMLGSLKLERFKVKKTHPYVANCRCPYCGDSATSKYKTRGYLVEREGGRVSFHCHNCGKSCTLWSLLKDIDPALHEQYVLERFKNTRSVQPPSTKPLPKMEFKPKIEKFAKRKIDSHIAFKHLKKISQLPPDHRAKKYIESRKLPADTHWRMYWCPKFFAWTNAQIPGKFPDNPNDEGRIIFPFVDKYGEVFGYQGRSLDPNSKQKYITILYDSEENPALFGFDACDVSGDVYVFEGAIDSMFFRNAVAQCGGENVNVGKYVPPEKQVYVLDNEPRSPDTISRLEKLIEAGKRVVIWPSTIFSKDVNDMIKNEGMEPEELTIVLRNNTFAGARAKLAFSFWKKNNSRRS